MYRSARNEKPMVSRLCGREGSRALSPTGSPLRGGDSLSPARHFRVSSAFRPPPPPPNYSPCLFIAPISAGVLRRRLTCAFIYVRAKDGGAACSLGASVAPLISRFGRRSSYLDRIDATDLANGRSRRIKRHRQSRFVSSLGGLPSFHFNTIQWCNGPSRSSSILIRAA